MSAATRRHKELARLARRMKSPRPDLPILRTAERPQSHEAARPCQPADPTASTSVPHSAAPAAPSDSSSACADVSPHRVPSLDSLNPHLATPQSIFPEWARIFPFPPDLDPAFRAWLFRHIEEAYAPSDTTEHYLAARIAQSIARQHRSAQREPDEPTSLWLRYETLASRDHRAAVRAFHAHRAALSPTSEMSHPPDSSRLAQPASHCSANPAPPPESQLIRPTSLPNPHNPTFAHPVSRRSLATTSPSASNLAPGHDARSRPPAP